MNMSYKKLWKLLIDRNLKKKELCRLAGVSTATVSKMAKGQSVTTDSLIKICAVLRCDIGDIAEIETGEENDNHGGTDETHRPHSNRF